MKILSRNWIASCLVIIFLLVLLEDQCRLSVQMDLEKKIDEVSAELKEESEENDIKIMNIQEKMMDEIEPFKVELMRHQRKKRL